MKAYLKLYLKLLVLACVALLAFSAFGDTGPSPVPTVAVPLPSQIPANWIILIGLLGGAVVGILDFVFAVNPSARSNGALHWFYLLCGGKDTPPVVK